MRITNKKNHMFLQVGDVNMGAVFLYNNIPYLKISAAGKGDSFNLRDNYNLTITLDTQVEVVNAELIIT